MPISKSAKKSLRVSQHKTALNRHRKALIKEALKNVTAETASKAVSMSCGNLSSRLLNTCSKMIPDLTTTPSCWSPGFLDSHIDPDVTPNQHSRFDKKQPGSLSGFRAFACIRGDMQTGLSRVCRAVGLPGGMWQMVIFFPSCCSSSSS